MALEQDDGHWLPKIRNADKAQVAQVVKYLAIGAGTALFELALFHLLYSVLQMGSTEANVLAVVVCTVINFLLNRGVAFKSSSNIVRSSVLYVLLFIFNTAFSSAVIRLAIVVSVPAVIGKSLAMCCTVCWNYFLYRKVVFK